jgi:hypothetical protein
MARFSPGARIGQVHGTFRPAPTDAGAPNALVYFMYHPAAALRDPGVEATSYRDMAKVPDALIEARARRLAKEPAASLALEPPVPVDKTPAAEPTAGMESSVSLQDRVLAELPDTQAIQPSIESPAAPVAPERTAIPVHPDHPAGPEIGEAILPAIDSVAADAERDPTDQLTLF